MKKEGIYIHLLHFCLGTMNCYLLVVGLSDPNIHLHIFILFLGSYSDKQLIKLYFLSLLLAICFREAHTYREAHLHIQLLSSASCLVSPQPNAHPMQFIKQSVIWMGAFIVQHL